MQAWNAVVLGGGDARDPFPAAHGAGVKALIELAGKPMGQHVLEALHDSRRVARVVYVGPLNADMRALVDEVVPDSGSLLGNLEAGVRTLVASSTESARVLVVTADVPLMTGTMLRDVLSAAPEVALVYPIVRREVCEAAFPGGRRTYARLQDGTFTGGNVFLLDPALIERFLPKIRQLFAMRKRPVALAGLIGWSVLLKLLVGRLRVAELERRVGEILGVPVRALVTPHAAIGVDVDQEADLTLVRARLLPEKAQGKAEAD